MGDIVLWRSGSRHKVSAEDAHAEVRRIQEKHGVAAPEAIVRAAASPKNVLHPEFEWNDTAAAREHRKQQARELVADIVVVKDEASGERAPVFVSVRIMDKQGRTQRGYMESERAVANPVTRAQVIAEALVGLEAWRRRYAHLHELAEVFTAIERVGKKVR